MVNEFISLELSLLGKFFAYALISEGNEIGDELEETVSGRKSNGEDEGREEPG